jgi:hypothetical protein
MAALTSDKAREVYATIMDGEVDADLSLIVRHAQARLKYTLTKTWRVGQRVRFNERTRPAKMVGKTGEVTKVNRSRVFVMLDQDRDEALTRGTKIMTEAEAAKLPGDGEAVGVSFFMTPEEMSITTPPTFLEAVS